MCDAQEVGSRCGMDRRWHAIMGIVSSAASHSDWLTVTPLIPHAHAERQARADAGWLWRQEYVRPPGYGINLM